MSIDRSLWKVSFAGSTFPAWPCPRCNGVGTLGIVSGSLHWQETADSIESHDDPDWEREWEKGRFSCLASCSRCHEAIAICGQTSIGIEDHRDFSKSVRYHSPASVSPAPPIFPIPSHCPKDIREEIEVAFELYWSDPSSSMNRLRTAVELLLTEMGIVRFVRSTKGKRQRLALHDRIVKLLASRPGLAESLLAVKYLGNAGSHPGQVTPDDVLDGMELMEHILHECYEQRRKIVSRLSKAINRRKGPRS